MTIILYSIPFFFLLLGLELAYSARAGRGLHRMNDSVADLSLGVLSQISGVFTKLFSIGIYIWIENHWALGKWDNTALNWVIAFVLVDFCYYWSHRLSHHINILWAGHVVHHSSEEYNLAVALRQSSLHGLMTWIFYAPLALIGIPWQMYVSTYALNLVYQFWIHTQAVGRLSKWMEFVMNTPSHHRVHHGINPRYLDRNHGGVFIIWDRFFGTFEPEREAVVYGITQPLRSWNPLWANVHVYWDIARSFGRVRSWSERWNVVFGPPGRQRVFEEKPASVKVVKYDPQIPAALAWYGLAQFMIVLTAAVVLLAVAEKLPLLHVAGAAFYIAVSLAAIAGVFEAARWAAPIEAARMGMLAGIGVTLWWNDALSGAFAIAVALFCVASLLWFLPRREHLTEMEIAPIM